MLTGSAESPIPTAKLQQATRTVVTLGQTAFPKTYLTHNKSTYKRPLATSINLDWRSLQLALALKLCGLCRLKWLLQDYCKVLGAFFTGIFSSHI